MAKKAKRKTLPENFKEIVSRGNPDEILSVFDSCDINAYSRKEYGTPTALMYPEMPEAVIRKLVEMGADINHVGEYNRTPLLMHAEEKPEHIPLLLELGAVLDLHDDSFGSETALHYCAGQCRPESVRALLALGADPTIPGGYFKNNALENLTEYVGMGNLCNAADTAEILLAQDMEITEAMRKKIRKLSEQFVFYRRDPAPDDPDEAAIRKLCKLFGVEPAARLQTHDGKSLIKVYGKTWQEQYDNLWKELVPPSGSAATVQGEAVRVIGRLSHEVLDNGGCNWDDDFRQMIRSLAGYLESGVQADAETLAHVKTISRNTDEQTFSAITRHITEWVAANPEPILLKSVPYKR